MKQAGRKISPKNHTFASRKPELLTFFVSVSRSVRDSNKQDQQGGALRSGLAVTAGQNRRIQISYQSGRFFFWFFWSYREKQKLKRAKTFPPGNKTKLQQLIRIYLCSLLTVFFFNLFLSQVSCSVCDVLVWTKIKTNLNKLTNTGGFMVNSTWSSVLPVFDRLLPVGAKTSYLCVADNGEFDKTFKVWTNPFLLGLRTEWSNSHW